MHRPKPLDKEQINLDKLICILEEYLDECERGDEDTDTTHYIFEEALMAVYGRNVFDYANKAYINEDEEK